MQRCTMCGWPHEDINPKHGEICDNCLDQGVYLYKGEFYFRSAIEEGFDDEELEAEDCVDASELFDLLVERGVFVEID